MISILGAGHSGSTPLAIALGSHVHAVCAGELHKLPRSGWTRNDQRRCACGLRVHECSFWGQVREVWDRLVGNDALKDYIALQDRFEKAPLSWMYLLMESGMHTERYRKYEEMTTELYAAICVVSGKGVVVDSSKSPGRGLALLVNRGLDVRVIHLIRDGRAVVWSRAKPRKRDEAGGVPQDRAPTPYWKTSVHWMSRNLKCEMIATLARRGRVRRVLYEELVSNPDDVLIGLGSHVDEDFSEVAAAATNRQPMEAGHMVGGNRLRMHREVAISPNFEWAEELPQRGGDVFWRLAGWQARLYGYQRGAR